MITCKNCGAQLDGSKFCSTDFCPKCGKRIQGEYPNNRQDMRYVDPMERESCCPMTTSDYAPFDLMAIRAIENPEECGRREKEWSHEYNERVRLREEEKKRAAEEERQRRLQEKEELDRKSRETLDRELEELRRNVEEEWNQAFQVPAQPDTVIQKKRQASQGKRYHRQKESAFRKLWRKLFG